MHTNCHTCGGELPAGQTAFCPHCGAPQITLALDFQTPDTSLVPGPATTGMRPPPRPQQVDWRLAIQCAIVVAAIGGVLAVGALRLPMLAPASMLWILSASLITLGLYQNRRPGAGMDARIGARIGLMVGICMAFGMAVPMAAAGVVARYGLRAMAGFDAQISTIFQTFVQQSKTPISAEELQMFQWQEFRAAYVLLGAAFLAAILLAVSAATGAFGGLLRTRRRAAVEPGIRRGGCGCAALISAAIISFRRGLLRG